MSTTPTAADADLILKLYELRREEVMRKARDFVAMNFWPETQQDLEKVVWAAGTQENAYLRQVFSYWDMACALANRGALHPLALFDSAQEAFLIYVKFRPFIPSMRERNPFFLANVEKFVTGTPEGQERLKIFEGNLKQWAEMRKKQAQTSSAGA
jgi:hypothetical protein